MVYGIYRAEESTVGAGDGIYGAELPTLGQEMLYLAPSNLL